MDLSLNLFSTSLGIYSIPKESKFNGVFLSIIIDNQCVLLLFLSSIFIIYAPYFILGKLSVEKTQLNLGL